MRLTHPALSASTRRARRGATTVEFAIVLPVLLLFILGGIEFNRLNILRHTADNAAYEAARHVIVPGATRKEAEDRALAILARVGIDSAIIDVEPDVITEDTEEVRVRVDLPVNENAWYLSLFTSGITVRGESTLRTERPPAIAAKNL